MEQAGGEPDTLHTEEGRLSRTAPKDTPSRPPPQLPDNLKDSDLTHLLSATYNLRIYQRSLAPRRLWMQDF